MNLMGWTTIQLLIPHGLHSHSCCCLLMHFPPLCSPFCKPHKTVLVSGVISIIKHTWCMWCPILNLNIPPIGCPVQWTYPLNKETQLCIQTLKKRCGSYIYVQLQTTKACLFCSCGYSYLGYDRNASEGSEMLENFYLEYIEEIGTSWST